MIPIVLHLLVVGCVLSTAPEDSAPEDSVPQDTAPQDSAPQDSAPQDSAPQDSAEEVATARWGAEVEFATDSHAVAIMATEAEERFAGLSAQSGDVDGDGWMDFALDGRAGFYVFRGPIADGMTELDADAFVPSVAAESYALASLRWDADLDGAHDLIFTAFTGSNAVLLLSPLGSEASLENPDTTFPVPSGDAAGPSFGNAAIVDLSGDGNRDAAMYSSLDPTSIDVFAAPVPLGALTPENAAARVAIDTMPLALAQGCDLDGDGFEDLVAVAGDTAPSVFAVPGPLSGEIDAADAVFLALELDAGDRAGTPPSCAGDLDDDGRADVVLGVQSDADALSGGAVWVGSGATLMSGAIADSAWRIAGDIDGGAFGSMAVILPDLDGDAHDDLVVVSRNPAADEAPDAAIYFGPVGAGRLASEPDTALFADRGMGDVVPAIGAVSRAGDNDADGFLDLVASVPLANDGRGAVWILHGGTR